MVSMYILGYWHLRSLGHVTYSYSFSFRSYVIQPCSDSVDGCPLALQRASYPALDRAELVDKLNILEKRHRIHPR